MGIYIDMEMPKEYGRCVVIFPDGRVTTEFGSQVIARAVPADKEEPTSHSKHGLPVK